MKRLAILLVLSCLPVMGRAQKTESKLFPYAYTVDDLDNGLRLITVPTDYQIGRAHV